MSAGGGWWGASARAGIWKGDMGPAGVFVVVRSGENGEWVGTVGMVGK